MDKEKFERARAIRAEIKSMLDQYDEEIAKLNTLER
jgi:siroheme synthase (precorrin-2 oxidase/ferrochelatase)